MPFNKKAEPEKVMFIVVGNGRSNSRETYHLFIEIYQWRNRDFRFPYTMVEQVLPDS